MSRDLKEIGTAIASDSPSFGVVEVSITTIHGKVGMCQGTAGSIERIAVAMLAYLESDFDVNLNESPLLRKDYPRRLGLTISTRRYILIVWALHFRVLFCE